MNMAAQASKPVASFPPAGRAQTIEEKRRAQSKEDVIKLHRACRLLRMALGMDRHPGGSLADAKEPPQNWIVRALVVVAEDCIISTVHPRNGLDKVLEMLAEKRALGALIVLEDEVLRIRPDVGDPGPEKPAAPARPGAKGMNQLP